MKEISIWKDTVNETNYQKLNEDKKVDVLIIGGGITGISTLYNLKDSNLKVILVEQNRLGMSVTGNSTGKLSYLQNDLLDKIRKCHNDEIASKYLKSQRHAIRMIKDTIKKENIDCDLEKVDSYLYTNKDNEIKKIEDLVKFLNNNGIETKNINNDIVDSKYMISVSDTYLFHPIKFIYGLIKNIKFPIYEQTSIKNITKEEDYYIAYTDKYKIKAQWIVMASHYPYFNLPYLFPIKSSLEKSYLSASKKDIDKISLISYSNPFISIRSYKDYLIYLSNSHTINKDTFDLENYQELMRKLNVLDVAPDYVWSNIDIITNDGIPYIGKIDDKLLIGTGYNTWGLASGFICGKILSDILLDKENSYIELFNPKRKGSLTILSGIKDAINSVDGYIKGYLDKNDNILYDKKDGKDVIIYDDGKEKYIVYQHCPHLGCKLLFNEIEKTWDCPCHGSRFDLDGKCISAPANKDITYK